jgi:hypothetical protein
MTNSIEANQREPRGFQPSKRRRNRIAAGVALAAIAIGGNIFVYSQLNNAQPVVQAVRDVAAGEQITSDMLRTVKVDADSSVNLIDGDELENIVGSYAKVRLVSGSLVTWEALQSSPLVRSGYAVVAIQVPDGALPVGLREQVPIELVIPPDRSEAGSTTIVISARVVALPSPSNNALGTQSLSVEVAADDAATVAAADDVRVVLTDPALSEPVAVDSAAEAES